MRATTLALVLLPVAGCAIVAGLGDFEKAEETDGSGGAGAGGPASSTSSATSSATTSSTGSTGGGGGAAGGPTSSSSASSTTGTGGTGATGGGGSGGAAPTCFDGKTNGGETDLDCGGPCTGCKIGQTCADGADCVTTKCSATKCACNDHLLISEVRTRGLNGAADEIVELYNPTSGPVTLDATWKIESRSATGSVYTVRWTAAGQQIPAYGHLLIVGSNYGQSPPGDATLTSGITDESSVRLKQDTLVIDAVCFCGALSAACNGFTAMGFSCEGPPATNPNGAGTDDDASLERLAGGPQGNCIDTIDSSKDFVPSTPAKPQNLASAVVPPP